ncbi:hypothetical protein HAX54_032687 [Datura stramonium]|uniref:Uncharacterized protein n=1 Tax=Datura stramonium TaxID=4076 RepID=A0ABS8VEG5_DATST|nr:hypothetical protein [Datura stramonium]
MLSSGFRPFDPLVAGKAFHSSISWNFSSISSISSIHFRIQAQHLSISMKMIALRASFACPFPKRSFPSVKDPPATSLLQDIQQLTMSGASLLVYQCIF